MWGASKELLSWEFLPALKTLGRCGLFFLLWILLPASNPEPVHVGEFAHTHTHQWQKPLRDPSRILGVRALQGYFKVWWSTENVVKQQSTNLFESLGHILETTVSSTPAGTWLFHTVFSQTGEKRIPTSEMKIAQILQPISATAQSKQLLLLYS